MEINYDKLREFFDGYEYHVASANTDLQYIVGYVDEAGVHFCEKGNSNSRAATHVCFGSLLAEYPYMPKGANSTRFEIFVPTAWSRDKFGNRLNTWMSAEELKEFLEYLHPAIPKITGINIIEEGSKLFQTKRKGYALLIDTEPEISKMEAKFFLFWLRCAIKFPYNLFVADAYTLKEKYYPKEELFNLFRIVEFSTKCGNDHVISYRENFSCFGPLQTMEEIKESIQKFSNINHKCDGGIYPDPGYEYSYELQRVKNLEKELNFRKSILNDMVSCRDSISNENPLIFLNNTSRFNLYQKVYEFKKGI